MSFLKLPLALMRNSWFCSASASLYSCLDTPLTRWLCQKSSSFSRAASAGFLAEIICLNHHWCDFDKSPMSLEDGGLDLEGLNFNSSSTALSTEIFRL